MTQTNNVNLFYQNLRQITSHPDIQLMQNFTQHHGNSIFNHCCDVTIASFRLAQFLHIHIDVKALITGAMLHDYYLYYRKEPHMNIFVHCWNHPKTALRNAKQRFDLTKKEQNIIISHMWPFNILKIPTCREAILVGIADKACMLREMFGYQKPLKLRICN